MSMGNHWQSFYYYLVQNPVYDKRSPAGPLHLMNNAVANSKNIQSDDYMETVLIRTGNTHQPVSVEELPDSVVS